MTLPAVSQPPFRIITVLLLTPDKIGGHAQFTGSVKAKFTPDIPLTGQQIGRHCRRIRTRRLLQPPPHRVIITILRQNTLGPAHFPMKIIPAELGNKRITMTNGTDMARTVTQP